MNGFVFTLISFKWYTVQMLGVQHTVISTLNSTISWTGFTACDQEFEAIHMALDQFKAYSNHIMQLKSSNSNNRLCYPFNSTTKSKTAIGLYDDAESIGKPWSSNGFESIAD